MSNVVVLPVPAKALTMTLESVDRITSRISICSSVGLMALSNILALHLLLWGDRHVEARFAGFGGFEAGGAEEVKALKAVEVMADKFGLSLAHARKDRELTGVTEHLDDLFGVVFAKDNH